MYSQDNSRSAISRFRSKVILLTLLISLLIGAWLVPAYFTTPVGAQNEPSPKVQVLTNHNDNARTGANLLEAELNTGNVNRRTFGKLFSLTVDGQVYAQPLYLSDVEIEGKGQYNVLFVATTRATVYAFDADNKDGANDKPLWRISLLEQGPDKKAQPVPSADYGYSILFGLVQQPYRDLQPEIGIIGTPVISPDGKWLYVVAATRERGGYFQRLHALSITNGKEKPGSPVTIEGTVPGIGDSSVNGVVRFLPRQHLQRPGLLYWNDFVFVAFGSHGDLPINSLTLSNLCNLLPGYHGWIFAYDAHTLKCLDIYNSTPNGGSNVLAMALHNQFAGGGIWMSGAGPAADQEGNLYFTTGNGEFNADKPGGTEYADSLVKLKFDPDTGKFVRSGFFTPFNQAELEKKDLDLGSCGVLLLPADASGKEKLAVCGGKEGKLYLADRDQLGGYRPPARRPEDSRDACLQSFLAAFSTITTRSAEDPESNSPNANAKNSKRKKRSELQQPHHQIEKTLAHKASSTLVAEEAEVSNIHSAPVYWNSPGGPLVYIWGENDVLKAFGLKDGRFYSETPHDPGRPDPIGRSTVRVPPGMPGAMLSLSARGKAAGTGILWASHPYRGDANHTIVPGVLQAFDATPCPEAKGDCGKGELALLWSSWHDPLLKTYTREDSADDVGTFAKFCPPTVAKGKVFEPTFSCQVEVYGLLRRREILTTQADAFLEAGRYANTPHTARNGVELDYLKVQRASDKMDATGNSYVCLRFDLRKVTEVPRSALLTLHVYSRAYNPGSALIRIYGMAEDSQQTWDVEKLTWNSAPAIQRDRFQAKPGEAITSHRVYLQPKDVITFDVTSFIAANIGKVVTLQLVPGEEKSLPVTFISSPKIKLLKAHPGDKARAAEADYRSGEPILALVWY